MEKKKVEFTIEQLFAMLDHVPMCINILNERAESVYCNSYTVDLYGVDSKQEYIDKFYDLTTENQPDGRNSVLAFGQCVLEAIEKGENHFRWLDIKKSGEELPLYISIYRLGTKDENGDELLLSSMRDLTPQIAGDGEDMDNDDYYYSRITYKNLFNTVAELSEEWFWVYDVNLSTIQFFGKGREILGLSAERQSFPEYVVGSGMVYQDDLDAFMHFDSNLKKGIVEPCEVRFISPNGAYRYYRIIYKTMYDKNGAPMFSIGKTYDIDAQKKLEVLSRTDLLTNCLNKITTENTVKNIITELPDSSHALFIIDVDDFKAVNDELGHYFGDIALRDIAKNLHANFRAVDIIGRIGGDEFLVFVKNIHDERVIKSKAKAIAEAFKKSYCGENGEYKISGSIGVSMYPAHGTSYEELYKSADKALYNSKLEGKDRYTIYSDAISTSATKNLTAVDNKSKFTSSYFDSDVATAVFDLMYQSQDVVKAMNTMVRIVGTYMNVNRCYVVETFDEGASYNITYEWTSDKTLAKKDEFQNISFDALKEIYLKLEENGIMSSDDPTIDSDNSFLLTQTKGKGAVRIIFGIEDNNKTRVWSEKEINTVQYMLKIISIFMAASGMHG